MAMQSGVGLSKILILFGAGYTGTILLNNGKLSDVLGQLQMLVKGLENSEKESGGTDYSDAIAAQLRRLQEEIRLARAQAQQLPFIIPSPGQGILTSMAVPAATMGALGYVYMWWKGLSFSDLMYVTKRNMANAVKNLTQHLESVSEALNVAKRHLTQRIENLDGKMDDQRQISKEIKNDVTLVKSNLEGLGYELENVEKMISGLDWRMGSLEYKQDWANEGVKYLCGVASGQRVEMPKRLQEQLKISGAPRGLLAHPDPQSLKGLKDIVDALSVTIRKPASDASGQTGFDKLDEKTRYELSNSCNINPQKSIRVLYSISLFSFGFFLISSALNAEKNQELRGHGLMGIQCTLNQHGYILWHKH